MSMDHPTDVSRERMKLLANIGKRRARAWIDARHATVADRGEEHSHHSNEDGGDDMAACLIADHAVDAHRSRRLDDDDAVDDEVPQFERAFEMGRSACGLQRICVGSHSPSLNCLA